MLKKIMLIPSLKKIPFDLKLVFLAFLSLFAGGCGSSVSPVSPVSSPSAPVSHPSSPPKSWLEVLLEEDLGLDLKWKKDKTAADLFQLYETAANKNYQFPSSRHAVEQLEKAACWLMQDLPHQACLNQPPEQRKQHVRALIQLPRFIHFYELWENALPIHRQGGDAYGSVMTTASLISIEERALNPDTKAVTGGIGFKPDQQVGTSFSVFSTPGINNSVMYGNIYLILKPEVLQLPGRGFATPFAAGILLQKAESPAPGFFYPIRHKLGDNSPFQLDHYPPQILPTASPLFFLVTTAETLMTVCHVGTKKVADLTLYQFREALKKLDSHQLPEFHHPSIPIEMIDQVVMTREIDKGLFNTSSEFTKIFLDSSVKKLDAAALNFLIQEALTSLGVLTASLDAKEVFHFRERIKNQPKPFSSPSKVLTDFVTSLQMSQFLSLAHFKEMVGAFHQHSGYYRAEAVVEFLQKGDLGGGSTSEVLEQKITWSGNQQEKFFLVSLKNSMKKRIAQFPEALKNKLAPMVDPFWDFLEEKCPQGTCLNASGLNRDLAYERLLTLFYEEKGRDPKWSNAPWVLKENLLKSIRDSSLKKDVGSITVKIRPFASHLITENSNHSSTLVRAYAFPWTARAYLEAIKGLGAVEKGILDEEYKMQKQLEDNNIGRFKDLKLLE